MKILKQNILDKLSTNHLDIFIVARIDHWNLIKNNVKELPFATRFIDPATYAGQEFVKSMIELNEKAYGKGMAAPSWTFANFGTIGAGITGGFMINGQPISKFSVVGDAVDPDISHEWTLLTDPDYQGEGLGTITLGLALEVCKHKKYHTFIMQTDNSSNLIYLKNPHTLNILSYGFIHTKKNSMLIKTQIPKNPFKAILQSQRTPTTIDKMVVNEIPSKSDFWVESFNHQLLIQMNDLINNGEKFCIKNWKLDEDKKIYILIGKCNE